MVTSAEIRQPLVATMSSGPNHPPFGTSQASWCRMSSSRKLAALPTKGRPPTPIKAERIPALLDTSLWIDFIRTRSPPPPLKQFIAP